MTIDHHTGMEEALFHALNSDGGALLDAFSVILSARWFVVVVGTTVLGTILLAGGPRRRELLLAFGLALVFSDTLGAQVLRPLIGRMRPCFALPPGTFRWLAPASDVGSLPSLHAANFFAMAFVTWSTIRGAGLVALGVAAAVAWSRVHVGVHWPSDVLAGAVWGASCATAALWLARWAVGRASSSGRSGK